MARKRQSTKQSTKKTKRPRAAGNVKSVKKNREEEEAVSGGAKEAAAAVGKKAANGAVKGAAKELLGKNK